VAIAGWFRSIIINHDVKTGRVAPENVVEIARERSPIEKVSDRRRPRKHY
jgi:hypothetical protein